MQIIKTYNEKNYSQDEIDLMNRKKGQYRVDKMIRQNISKRMSLAFKIVYGIIFAPAMLAVAVFVLGWFFAILVFIVSIFSKSIKVWGDEVYAPALSNFFMWIFGGYKDIVIYLYTNYLVLFIIGLTIMAIIAILAIIGAFIKGWGYCDNCDLRDAYSKKSTLIESKSENLSRTEREKKTVYIKDRQGFVIGSRDEYYDVTRYGKKTSKTYEVLHQCRNCKNRYYTIEKDENTYWD